MPETANPRLACRRAPGTTYPHPAAGQAMAMLVARERLASLAHRNGRHLRRRRLACCPAPINRGLIGNGLAHTSRTISRNQIIKRLHLAHIECLGRRLIMDRVSVPLIHRAPESCDGFPEIVRTVGIEQF